MAFKNIYANKQTDEVRRPWLVRHWGLSLIILCLLLAGAAALAWRPASRYWHGHKSRQFAQQAQEFMKDGKWAEAAPLLEKAYLADPKEPVTLRACAFYEEHGAKNPAYSGHYLKQLIATDAADAADKAAMGKALVASGKIGEARELHDKLPAADRSSKEALELEAQLARKQGDTARAESLLRQALMKDPSDPASILRLATLDLGNPMAEIQQSGWDRLWELANTDAKESLVAIDQLASNPLTTSPQSAALLDLASKKASVPPRLRYHVVSAFMRLHTADRDAMLNLEASRVVGRPEEEMEAFCQWLTDENEHEHLLKFLPFEKAVTSARTLPFHLNALMRLGRWSELSQVLKDEKRLHLDALSIAELRAKCARGLGEPPQVIRDLLERGREFAIAARTTAGLDRFANVSLALGYPDIALACLKSVAPTSAAQREALYDRIMSIQRSEGDMIGLLNSLREITALPGTVSQRVEEFIYLRLLCGVEIETALDDASAFAAKGRIRPQALVFFKALSAYRLDDRPTLEAALSTIDPKSLPANWRAVLAGLISETGEKSRAFQIAEKIRSEALSAEEKAIFALAL